MKDDTAPEKPAPKKQMQSAVIRFAGDSGDGIQITGAHFTNESAHAGNDIATFPNYPSEIRAPAGTLAGVSGFQIHFGSREINTPGDSPDVLVALNPAALKANLKDVKGGGILILNKDAFTKSNLKKVGYEDDPCDDQDLATDYKVHVIPITSLTKQALEDSGLAPKEVERCKNFFALGVTSWMFNRPVETTVDWIRSKFAHRPELVEANIKALKAGISYATAKEIFSVSYVIKPASLEPGTYRNLSGTTALAYGLLAASQKSGLELFYGAYPITPASDILHELARHKRLGITTFQAEDEIAAICSALGASYAGKLSVTGTSGPGMALKTEALGLAVITELPLVIVNVQRAGPSTGMPTKTEQTDLFQALYGRNGEAPICVLAAASPKSAFTMAYEACRIAVKYMTPVVLLSEGYITNTSSPWLIPDPAELRPFEMRIARENNNPDGHFLPYLRDEKTLARPWAIPGSPEIEHRIGGLEKQDRTGFVSHDADNHQLMCGLRAEKIARIADDIPPLKIDGEPQGDLLVLGWGGTRGAIREGVRTAQQKGYSVSSAHLHYLNPLPRDLGEVMSRFKEVLVPEMNSGQLRMVLREKYLRDVRGLNQYTGQPIKIARVLEEIETLLGKDKGA